ncbi:MAG: SulP family inorganic anion transporter [Anaerolineae bacterium]
MSEVEVLPPYSADGRRPRLMAEFEPRRLLPSVMAGLIVGLMTILLALSFAALVFSEDLAEQLPRAIGTTLFSAVVINLVVALGSSFRTAIAPIQDPVAAVLAVIVASIATNPELHGSLEPVLPTVLAAIALTSLLTGAFFLALGVFRLGRMIRYIPYPVVGGFLAGAGWLVAHGSIAVLTDLHLDIKHLPELAHGDMLARLLPGVALAVVLLALSRRGTHILAVPVTLIAATGLFYATVWLTGSSVAEAAEGGLLLGPFHTNQLWQPLTVDDLQHVNWRVLVEQWGDIAALLVINAIALLLNSTELELVLRKDADLDRELRVAGVANVVAGAGGGMAGYLSLPLTHLGSKQGADSRVVGLVAALFAGVVLVFVPSLLAYVPRVVLGGLLLFTGLELLVEWAYDSRRRLPRIDYAMVLSILLVIAVAGFLAGVALGVAVAIVLFVVSYSRINVVKHQLSGRNYQSNVDRPPLQRRLLQERGDELYIVKLQGFLFFGTANSLLEQVRRRLDDPTLPTVLFAVLDFRLVTGMDTSASLSFTKLRQIARARSLTLVLTNLAPEIDQQLQTSVEEEEEASLHIFADLDHGIEWCENQMLAREGGLGATISLFDYLAALLPTHAAASRLLSYLDRLELPAGEYVVHQGAPSDELYLVESGELTALLERPDDEPLRLRTVGAGTPIGELGFYLGTPRTASVIAQQPTVLYRLTRARAEEINARDPEVAAVLHELVARILAERLVNSNTTVAALLQ